ncbi:GNAT family N-acetyltransferase [Psychrosphaera sp.]|nr:GNAT family N-acetyltransferase [Psychrosphaera sp.]
MVNNISSTPQVNWHVIEELNELRAIEPKWQLLYEKSKLSFFNSPSWLLAWVDVFWQSQWQLKVIAGYAGKELVALAPFYVNVTNSKLSLKKLMPLGQGEPEEQEVMSEYQDLLLYDVTDADLVGLNKLIKQLEFDRLEWNHVLNDSKIGEFLKLFSSVEAIHNGYRYLVECGIDAQQTKSALKKWQRCSNKLADKKVLFNWSEPTEELWHKLALFHQNRWQNKKEKGAFSHVNFEKFHHHNGFAGGLKMSVMTINDDVVAINYFVLSDDTLHFYQSGWDEAFEEYAPGFCLHYWSIKNAIKDNYDLMISPTASMYKQRFCIDKPQATFNISYGKWPLKHAMKKVIMKVKKMLLEQRK